MPSPAPASDEEVFRIRFLGPFAKIFRERTRFVNIEGALNCGKTTICLWKEWYAATQWWPGIHIFIGRFADGDNQTKLIPAWNDVVEQGGIRPVWNSKFSYYEFPNKSRVYSYGLQSPDPRRRYSKLRGLGVSRIYIDQGEELPPDFFPELAQRMRQNGYPHQFTMSPNPLDKNSWLASEFPDDNSRPNRVYYSISLFDNAHNLPADRIEDALATYPVTHAKHRTAILGQRGLNVTGKPVYEAAFNRQLHVRPIAFNPNMPLEVGFDFGKHHPCALFRQRTPYGGVHYLGGLMGQNVFLEDFAPIVRTHLALWFGANVAHEDCCDPAGSHDNSQGVKVNGVSVLKANGFHPKWADGSNRPSIREALMERIAGQMRKRTPMGEAYGVNNDRTRWLLVTGDGKQPTVWEFLSDGDEAGYVWDEHLVSEGSKQYRKAKKDGWYEHGQNAKEYLELNFGSEPVKAPEPEPIPYVPRSTWS